ncbi:hypothetical protein AMTR_s00004p00087070 [Amborella trichopoda]|uniref:Pentacotripeptide-repeat region of PRORP domain-containing protein n=1 Tax=Amborella trichopoda TaxID=13333 RepID=W1NDX2_AMBTC|nr:hypothetical protein AMTR_s00004p00087070 [Amborella trichopoda]
MLLSLHKNIHALKCQDQFSSISLSKLQNYTSPHEVRSLHAQILKTQHSEDLSLLSRLAHRYLLCHCLGDALQVFAQMKREKDPHVFLWNEFVKWYSRNGFYIESMEFYRCLSLSKTPPNEFTFTFILPACAGSRSLFHGRSIHAQIILRNMDSNLFVATALIDMYGKCGDSLSSRQVFDELRQPTTASFNALISGYVTNGEFNEAMWVFNQMLISRERMDAMTMASILHACASLGALQQGRWIHELIERENIEKNEYVGAALINMYAKCGSIADSLKVFDEINRRDLVLWTSIICGLGSHGLAYEAERIFLSMIRTGIKPDTITFVGILCGFSHVGLVEKGWEYYKLMSSYGMEYSLEHCNCMVDMLGRAGKLEEAENFVREMDMKPDAGIWGALLNACKIYKDVERAERVVEEVLTLDSDNAGWTIALSIHKIGLLFKVDIIWIFY